MPSYLSAGLLLRNCSVGREDKVDLRAQHVHSIKDLAVCDYFRLAAIHSCTKLYSINLRLTQRLYTMLQPSRFFL